ncbi:hypothetical protein EK21DRAFT_109524 [Setomelanomma holmii]|uniref:Uncharacterized protein n=1 Tax=Setomelanomma holmii TaxID=210430 RepID=A0A9P4HEH8_9PLEO|nr:hypothetical protein EK21DRAFT_109524 [Setomelanomma holmii]
MTLWMFVAAFLAILAASIPFRASQDRTSATCSSDHDYFTDLCPGGDNVQCCMSKTTVDKFVDFPETTYILAVQYKNGASGKKSANELVMEWLRHEKYDGLMSGWTTLIGSVDGDWINFAKDKKHPMFDQFADPHFCGQAVETDHLGAKATLVVGETTLALYMLSGRSHASRRARSWVKDRIIGNTNTFKLLDAIEDADAFSIGLALSNLPARAIHDVAKDYYKPKGAYRTRLSALFKKRFTDREHAETLANEMLTGPGHLSPGNEDSVIAVLRAAAIKKDAILNPLPSSLSAAELAPFLDGFVDALKELAKDIGKLC